jgi:hypothetical protein
MTKIAIYAALAFAVIAIAGGWYAKQQYDAEQRGREIERAKIAAQSNQNIATRRETDATFDKMDARQLCLDAPVEPRLEWVFENGKSFCR